MGDSTNPARTEGAISAATPRSPATAMSGRGGRVAAPFYFPLTRTLTPPLTNRGDPTVVGSVPT
jgi:hypothetical protein